MGIWMTHSGTYMPRWSVHMQLGATRCPSFQEGRRLRRHTPIGQVGLMRHPRLQSSSVKDQTLVETSLLSDERLCDRRARNTESLRRWWRQVIVLGRQCGI